MLHSTDMLVIFCYYTKNNCCYFNENIIWSYICAIFTGVDLYLHVSHTGLCHLAEYVENCKQYNKAKILDTAPIQSYELAPMVLIMMTADIALNTDVLQLECATFCLCIWINTLTRLN